jgi:microcin C transport system permease protein
MGSYILRRILFIFPVLFSIFCLNFFIIQLAPGGPIEYTISRLEGIQDKGDAVFEGGLSDQGYHGDAAYKGTYGIPEDFIQDLKRQYGFDKPLLERFWLTLKNYMTFKFGNSYFQGQKVLDLIIAKLPVSLSLGIWSTLLVYLISIPLGIVLALRAGSKFDLLTTGAIILGHAIPSFVLSILFIIFFAGGTFFEGFPLKGLVSENWDQLNLYQKAIDYLWHLALPTASLVIGGIATPTLLLKTSLLSEIHKQYVVAIRSKGASETHLLYKHVLKNALLPLVSKFPTIFAHMFLTSNIVIEIVFSLDGLGLLGYEAAVSRDYPLLFGILYVFTLVSLVLYLIRDLLYVWVDPRIHFKARI